jgi:hypothetical protein
MTPRRAPSLILAALLAAGATACGGSSGSPSAAGASSGSLTAAASHNAGRDCLACHRDLSVAGTVYRESGSVYPGATVRLTTAPDGGGTVVLSLSADASGNAYTSQRVSFGSGLYVDVAGSGDARRAMKAAITGGACNACHDASNRIRAD